MPKVLVRHESDSELRLAHPYVSGWIFVLIGGAVAWAGLRFVEAGFGRWLTTGMGILFGLIGLGGGLWRYELTLDLMARCYRGRRGFWPSPRPLQGSLEELAGVVLTRQWRRSSSSEGTSSEHAVWVVSLEFDGWKEPVSLFETSSEKKGYGKLEHLSRRLQVDAVDRTGGEETRRDWNALDRPATARSGERARVESVPALPAGSRIEWTPSESGSSMAVLPAMGFNVGAVFLFLFGLPFAGFGAVALLAVSKTIDVKFEGSTSAAWIVGSVFVVIGLGFCAGAIFGCVAREIVRRQAGDLVVSLEAFGREYRIRRIPRTEVEGIEIKPSNHARSKSNQVVIRSDRRVIRMGGELTTDEQRWLLSAVAYLVR